MKKKISEQDEGYIHIIWYEYLLQLLKIWKQDIPFAEVTQ